MKKVNSHFSYQINLDEKYLLQCLSSDVLHNNCWENHIIAIYWQKSRKW